MTSKHAASGITLVMLAAIAWLPSTISEALPLLYHDSLEAGFGTSSKARGDFDDDGRIDLVVGVFREDNGAGAIHVFPGSTDGITGAADFLIRQSDIPLGADVEDDNFGRSLAAGDFDGDGFDDLAAGATHKDIIELDEGALYVIPGSPSGLDPSQATMFSEQDILAADGPEIMDGFGAALAAGNLGRGAADDLAIGSVEEGVGAVGAAGTVTVAYGSPTGLDIARAEVWSQASPGVADAPEEFDTFGFSLAIADLGRSSQADLAIGAPGEGLHGRTEAGAIHVLYGSPAGVTSLGSQFWHQGKREIENRLRGYDFFGFSLAAGNVGRSSHADLAIGVPRERIGERRGGAVAVLYGSPSGLTDEGDQLLSQNSPGMAGRSELSDSFGWSVAIGNLGRGEAGDLAISAPGDDVDDVFRAGVVHVVYGSPTGLHATGSQVFSQATPGISDTPEFADHFGSTLAIGDIGGTAVGDLVIGVPHDPGFGAQSDAGVIHVLFGTPAGVTVTGAQFLHQDRPGIADESEGSDAFGGAFG
jgi:hypothetical protein